MSSNFIQLSNRVRNLPTYVFSEINVLKAEAQKRGLSLLSLAIGDPDQPTPTAIVDKMKEAISRGENHLYSPYEGSSLFRQAVSRWMSHRFGVTVDADKEVVALIGSKEGIGHFPLAFCNPGDKALYPSPGYPVFQTSLLLAGANPIALSLMANKGFVPDLNRLEELLVVHQPKYMLLNFPANPTSAVCSRNVMTEIVYLAKKHKVILAYDNAYSEIYYNEDDRPSSILECPGAKDIAIEFHSLSKTFNMTGWRMGFAVGNPELVAGLLKVKTNIDSGPLLSVQEAGAFALDNADQLIPGVRQIYAERRDVMLKILDQLGIEYLTPKATFFVWAKVPGNMKSMDLTRDLIAEEGLVVTPGSGFGREGEGFFRLALTLPPKQIEEAMGRFERFLKRH